jgi:enterochelin esterase family protein
MDCLPVIRALIERRVIAPVNCLFVSSGGAERRHVDFTCNDRYARFIAHDVVAWTKRQIDSLDDGNHLIAGVSLGGLAAAHIALTEPAVFSHALCQSGSFWWLADRRVLFSPTNAKVWLSVGNEETQTDVSHPPTGLYQRISQIEGVERAAKAFESLGVTVSYTVYSGAHTCADWRNDLAPALQWLIGDRSQ